MPALTINGLNSIFRTPLQVDTFFKGSVFGIPSYGVLILSGFLGLVLGIGVRIVLDEWNMDLITLLSVRINRVGSEIDDDSPGQALESEMVQLSAMDRDEPPEPSLSATVEEHLTAGDFERTVKRAYSEIRHFLASETGVSTDGTHWDFFKECETIDVIPLDDLFEMTELYERAVFGSYEITKEDAQRAVTYAETLLHAIYPEFTAAVPQPALNTDDPSSSPEPVLSEDVTDRLSSEDYEGTVEVVYIETQRRISTQTEASTNGTHWDFYRDCETFDAVPMNDLFELTELYEQAAFGSSDITAEDANKAVNLAETLLHELQSSMATPD